MKMLLTGLIFFYAWAGHAQTDFLDYCAGLPDDVSIKDIFQTKDCKEIAKQLRTKTSFSELILPNRSLDKSPVLSEPWTDNFPHLHGLNKKIGLQYLFKPEYAGTMDVLITDLLAFRSFKNLTHLSYSPEYPYYEGATGICEILRDFPSLKIISLRAQDLKNPTVDKCLSRSNLEGVIITKPFKGFNRFSPKTKVIGIEYFVGDLARLAMFKRLKYVGISNQATTLAGLEALYGLTELTHFSINIHRELKDLSKLGLLKNLTHLSVVCVDKNTENSPFAKSCESRSSLKDVTFLSHLTWLKELTLSNHSITDLSALSEARELQSLKLRGNLIEQLPTNLKSKLQILDLSGNKLKSIESLGHYEELVFLNLSGNPISDLHTLSRLRNLKFLNLSSLPMGGLQNIGGISSLEVLNLNGGGGMLSIDLLEQGALSKNFTDYQKDLNLLIGALFHDYTLSPWESYQDNCKTYPSIDTSFPYQKFPNLRMLSLSNNQLTRLPDFTSLKKLRYLNLNRNNISELDQNQLPLSLVSLQMKYNGLRRFPRLERLSNLREINFFLNDLKDISDVRFLSEEVSTLDLASNLIQDISPLTSNFGHTDYLNFLRHVDFELNPIGKDQASCPTGVDGFIAVACQEYHEGKPGAILNPPSVEGVPMIQERDEKKCSMPSLDFGPRKRPSPDIGSWFEN